VSKTSQKDCNVALSEIAADKREDALNRVGVVLEFEKFSGGVVRTGGTRTEALAAYSTQHNIPVRTLQRWITRYRDEGIIGLVDTRGRSDGFAEPVSEEAFDFFKSMWLTEQRLSVKQCWLSIRYENRRQKKGWAIPGLRTMYGLVNRRIPLPVQVLHREGLAAYEAKCAPYIQTNPDSVEPGQVWVGDHHQFNCWIRHNGQWIRPWLTAWEDMRSRAIVGWHISPSPNQTTIMLAMKKGIKAFGPPDSVKIDNGKDYDSEMWTGTTKAKRKTLPKGYIDERGMAGLYAMMQISVSFAIPYHPQSKLIERFFDTADCQFTKTIATYCGKDSDRKPENLTDLLTSQKGIDGALDLNGFAKLFGRYVEVYNDNSHSGVGMDGRTPGQVLATRTSKRMILDDVLELLMRVWSRELIVGKNGVKFKRLSFGQYNADLIPCYGKTVRLAYDPDDLRQVYVYDAITLKLITMATQNQFVNYGSATSESHLRNAMQQKAHALKTVREYRDSSLVANMDLASLAIRAREKEQASNHEEQANKTLRPVQTLLDGQVMAHKQLRAKAKLAARPKEDKIDLDLSLLGRKEFVPDPAFSKALEEGLAARAKERRAEWDLEGFLADAG
jgi:putative transposase